MQPFRLAFPVLLLCLTSVRSLSAYSVLTHEALVDALWDVRLRPFLLEHYPAATADELKRAHGFAYGGAIVQDLGYYPHGSAQFSDLTHYARSGDFILSLFREAHDLNELAFALGALSHYSGDLEGHSEGTNIAEPILYPNLAKKFGKVITYEDNPAGHVRTEYGFDVLEVARGNFAPAAYHDFIGFFVAKDLMARAFHDTYGLDLSDVFSNFDLAVASYRGTVSKTIPFATRVAWAGKKDEIRKAQPGITHRRFVYILKRSSYEREWGKRPQEPNWVEKFAAFIVKLLPPIGPLRDLHLKLPTPPVERMFEASFNSAVKQYSADVTTAGEKRLRLPDKNYDTGGFTPSGAYRLNDDIHAVWLHKLAGKNYSSMTPAIKNELLTFYADLNAPNHTKQNPAQWRQTLNELAALKN